MSESPCTNSNVSYSTRLHVLPKMADRTLGKSFVRFVMVPVIVNLPAYSSPDPGDEVMERELERE
jgi:hypothetical protein